MEQFFALISYLYWGSVVAATVYTVYVVWFTGPVVTDLVPGAACVDCRSRGTCNCLEYRLALASDIEKLKAEIITMVKHYHIVGWPSHLNSSIERRLKFFNTGLDNIIELLKYQETAAMDCFENIDIYCTFISCSYLALEPKLQESARGVKERRNNPPQSWPPEPNEPPWQLW